MIDNSIITNDIFDNIDTYKNKIHIRIIERTKKKKLTLIENLPSDIDLKKLVGFLKKTFNCSGTIFKTDNNNVLQFSGDNRFNFKNFLIKENICIEDNIIVHNY